MTRNAAARVDCDDRTCENIHEKDAAAAFIPKWALTMMSDRARDAVGTEMGHWLTRLPSANGLPGRSGCAVTLQFLDRIFEWHRRFGGQPGVSCG